MFFPVSGDGYLGASVTNLREILRDGRVVFRTGHVFFPFGGDIFRGL